MIEGTYLNIGPAKNGTTSFFKMLSNHPQIHPSKVKEPGWFGYNINENYNKFLELWDFNNINYSRNYILFTGEVMRLKYLKSDYLKLPNIKKFKFIFILRNFNDYLLSFIFHNYVLTNIIDVDWYIKKNIFYYEYLENISKKIGKENILIIHLNEIESNQTKIYDFLEIDNHYKFKLEHINPNSESTVLYKKELVRYYINKKHDILSKIYLDEFYKIQEFFNIDLDKKLII
jgi:hypothetical protein